MCPRYTWKNKENNQLIENWITISERDQFEIDHPELEQVISASLIGFGQANEVKKRLPADFKEKLRNIKKHHRAPHMEDFSSTHSG